MEAQLLNAIRNAQTRRMNLSSELPDLQLRLSRLRGVQDRCPLVFNRYKNDVNGFEAAASRARQIPNMRIANWCSSQLSKALSGWQRTEADNACVNIPQKIETEIVRVENEIRMRENQISMLDGQIRMWQMQLSNLG